MFSLISVRFGSCEVQRLNRALANFIDAQGYCSDTGCGFIVVIFTFHWWYDDSCSNTSAFQLTRELCLFRRLWGFSYRGVACGGILSPHFYQLHMNNLFTFRRIQRRFPQFEGICRREFPGSREKVSRLFSSTFTGQDVVSLLS